MYKYLLFSEPKALVFYSSATAIDRFESYLFATTKMRQLIFRETSPNATKASINLESNFSCCFKEIQIVRLSI